MKAKKVRTESQEAAITGMTLFSLQVCVPKAWSNEKAEAFARQTPCGTTHGWCMRKKKDTGKDYVERAACAERKGFVHIVYDC